MVEVMKTILQKVPCMHCCTQYVSKFGRLSSGHRTGKGQFSFQDNGDLLQKVPCTHCCSQCPRPCSRPPLTRTSAKDSWTLMGKSGAVSCGVTAPFSWVMVHTRCCLCPARLFPQSSVSSGGSVVGLMATSSERAYATPRSAASRAPVPVTGHC